MDALYLWLARQFAAEETRSKIFAM